MAKGFDSIEDLIQASKQQHAASSGQFEEPTNLMDRASKAPASSSVAEKTEEALEEKLVQFQQVSKEDETRNAASRGGFPYINLVGFPIAPETISIMDESVAKAVKALVFFRLENQIRVGAVNPADAQVKAAVSELQKQHQHSNILLYQISQHSFDVAFELYKAVTRVKKIEYGVHITAEQLKKYQEEIPSYEILQQKLQNANMTEAFAMLISSSLNQGSSDVHIEAEKDTAVIRFRIDGVLIVVAHFPLPLLPRLVSRVKAIAGLKINITDVPQDGRITIEFDEGGNEQAGNTLDIRVSTLPSAFGESIVMRLLKSSSVGLSFEDLGMRPKQFEVLKAEIEKPNGMIITTGPTGSGKTTTLYAILNKLNTQDTKIITLENPVEYKLEGIVQSQIEEGRYDFAMGLRSILRQDPDIIMVGEIRDYETAKTAVEAALTGHLMLSTIHTNDAAGAVPRFLGMGVEGIFLAPALNAVIGQRLVRRVCSDCIEVYKPTEQELQRAREWAEHIPENSGERVENLDTVEWKHGKGCAKCGDTGYHGRIGIYEIFTMSAGIEKEILSSNVSEYKMKELLHEAGMVTMGQDGILKAIDGITTLDEVFRVAKE